MTPRRPSPSPPASSQTQTGSSTRSVHEGERAHHEDAALSTPIHQTATYWFEDSAELRAYAEGRLVRDEYGRYSNPTWRAVERKLAALEGAEAAVLTASGMAAATTTFLALLERGDHIVVTNDCYRRTREFITKTLSKLEVTATVIAPADLAALESALQANTRFFFTESPTNPYLRVIDLPEAARLSHARGAQVLVDATLASPVNQQPLASGADLVLHSATKYLSGHNDVMAGAVCGATAVTEKVRALCGVLGGVLDPHAAWLLLRGMKTLGLRVARANENGLAVARWLETQPRVARVWHPGLASHPDHKVARTLMRGFGGVVSFEIAGDLDATIRFTDACRLPYIAPSFGGTESLIEMPALMSYWELPKKERQRYGIHDNLVRLGCGIEDSVDLIADLAQALAKV